MKKITATLLIFLSLLYSPINAFPDLFNNNVVEMPIRTSASDFHGSAPIEKRGREYRKWLAPSVKIAVSGGSGSGTIVWYDSSKNTAYVATCGHLWNSGVMSAEEGLRKNLTCKVITWYQNDKKLESPKTYNAKVIFYSYLQNADTALVTFEPDWSPTYFPIAPKNYKYEQGSMMHSLGCDNGDEVAHYDVEVVGLQANILTTIRNSPRPGRSGGGLMDDRYYTATCVMTSDVNGEGEGYFTPLAVIHDVYSRYGHDFLLKIKPSSDIAKKLKIIDMNTRQQKYDENYILVPN